MQREPGLGPGPYRGLGSRSAQRNLIGGFLSRAFVAWPPILVRYGEIGIKSRSVRIRFEKQLVERVEEQLVERGVEAEVVRREGRLLVRAAEVERAIEALRHTFGIVSVSPAVQVEPTMDAVGIAAAAVAREHLRPGGSFAMRVKRAGTHPFTSMDVAKHAADHVFRAAEATHAVKPTVDLTAPDLAIHVEMREGEAFVFTQTVPGPGGLPLGSQGRVGVLVDSPRAAHAAWLMGKRGSGLWMFAPEEERAREWLAPLRAWVPNMRIRPLDGSNRGEHYAALAPELPRHRCMALVVADGIDEQILSRDQDAFVGVPVFRPLVGFAGKRFEELCRAAELPEV